MTQLTLHPRDVLDFWFGELAFKDWFTRSDALDLRITERFRDLHLALSRERPAEWLEGSDHLLALILVFDQFPRNIYRGSPLAFATDELAIALARDAVARGLDQQVAPDRRAFFYLPYEHQENISDQDECVRLFEALGDPVYLDYAEKHRAVIRQFGRFPHRNPILLRPSSPEELDYLAQPGAGF